MSRGDLEIFQNSISRQEQFVFNFCCRVQIWRIFKIPVPRKNDVFLISTIEGKFGDFSKLHFKARTLCLFIIFGVKWSFGDFWKLPAQARENIFNFNSIVMQTSTEMGTAHLLHCSPPEVLNFISLFLIRLFDEINCGLVGKKPRS
jgi:hypothetical protein